ncbi:hypothetical protein QYM36_017370, partial [Artemia franciscana]
NDVPELKSRLEYATGRRQPIKTTTKRVGATHVKPMASKPSVYGQQIAPTAQFAPQHNIAPQPPAYGQQRTTNATPITSLLSQQVAPAQPSLYGNQRPSTPSIVSQQAPPLITSQQAPPPIASPKAPSIQAMQQAAYGTSGSSTFLPAAQAATASIPAKPVFQPTNDVPELKSRLEYATGRRQPIKTTAKRLGATHVKPMASKPSVYGQQIAPTAQFAPQHNIAPQPPTYGQQRTTNATPITSLPSQQVAPAQPSLYGNQRPSTPSIVSQQAPPLITSQQAPPPIGSQQAPSIQAMQQAAYGTSGSSTFLPAAQAATASMPAKPVFQPTIFVMSSALDEKSSSY